MTPPPPLPAWCRRHEPTTHQALADYGFSSLPITARHADGVRALPAHHRDPCDRMLIVQAQLEGLAIVTRDPVFARYDVAVRW